MHEIPCSIVIRSVKIVFKPVIFSCFSFFVKFVSIIPFPIYLEFAIVKVHVVNTRKLLFTEWTDCCVGNLSNIVRSDSQLVDYILLLKCIAISCCALTYNIETWNKQIPLWWIWRVLLDHFLLVLMRIQSLLQELFKHFF